MREQALEIFMAAVQSVQPQQLLPRLIRRKQDTIWLNGQQYNTAGGGHIYITGAGKAAAAMARETENILGNLLQEGIIVTKYEHGLPLQKIRCIEAGHPVPDDRSLQAGHEILNLLQKAGEQDIVIALISGGASALLADCAPGTTLAELQEVFTRLLASGATIQEMNTVRKHLSPGIKGGQLARAAYPATLVSFVLSDVIGDPPESIASGPTVPDPSTFADAWAVLEKYRLTATTPTPILQWLQRGLEGHIPETPKPGDQIFEKTHTRIIGSNRIALRAAAAMAKELDYHPVLLTDALTGEARDKAAELVSQILQYDGPRPACLLMGGETTVTIKNNGKGGRNQEFVLAALCALQKMDIPPGKLPVILSAGTDGTDGPTDAAGAVIDHEIMTAVKKLSLDADAFLQQNDAYHFFQQAGGHIITGPTHTNVMDVVVVLVH